MSDLTKIGPSMLEMEDLAQYLDLVAKFVTKKQIEDAPIEGKVLKIAGVDSNLVAQAAMSTDRTTVRNALNLDGHPADYFMSDSTGKKMIESLTEDSIENKISFSKEFTELRDEVYQLREELAKSGVTTGYTPYAGYYDMFRDKQMIHEYDVITTATKDSTTAYEIIVEGATFDSFHIGDRIMMKSLISGTDFVADITDKLPDGETLIFNNAAPFNILKDKCQVYKSKGNIINGTYVFGEIAGTRPGSAEIHTGFDDDTYTSTKKLDTKNKGIGYTFRISEDLQKNYLAKVNIKVRKIGNPGALMCYIIDERDMPEWKNSEYAQENKKNFNFFAKSQPLEVDASKGTHIASFSFYDPTAGELVKLTTDDLTDAEMAKLTDEEKDMLATLGYVTRVNSSSYPLLTETDNMSGNGERIRYCMIIEPLNADDNNYYIITMVNKNTAGVIGGSNQENNRLYNYEAVNSSSTEQGLKTSDAIDSSDLYYGIVLLEAVHQAFIPYDSGMYTSTFKFNEDIEATFARLALRINREGMYEIDPAGTTYLGDVGNNANIKVSSDGPEDGFRYANKVAIGTNIRKLNNASNRDLTIEKGLHIEARDIVYPIGYSVTLVVKSTYWDSDTCRTITEDEYKFNMPLVKIMKDTYKKTSNASDRLIFETDFACDDDKFHKFNEFEIQIKWNKSCAAIKDITQAGQILDLVCSFNHR